ncbi:hypothetical protein Goshw_004250 [Gossypium schwendimanii]|uniref:Uncharacterized protein n=1 Tax=Gossypium schwendimanii TaxID=34291 RepID=A0A7J9MXJ4_GOSSC|nr:hypothetical protein [Gossypium schwendimanii]
MKLCLNLINYSSLYFGLYQISYVSTQECTT